METTKIPPIPLILFSQETRSYILTPEAQSLFTSIPPHHQIAILTILGPYRTGKSLLLNRVLLSKSQGFQVGNTVNSCTKGLWVYAVNGRDFLKSLPPGETSGLTEDSTVMIIDTEGFGSVNVTQTHDNRVFLMALMISSLVIYNSVGTIDENALNQLALITSLSNEIQSKLDAPITMPFFIWILRDFMLKLEDKNGNKITSKDYLETSLELQKGVSDIIEKKNKVRRMFNHYFPERDCVTLPRPMEEEEALGRLNEIDDHLIRKEFVDQLGFLRTKILKKCCTKSIIIDSKTKQTKPIIGGTMIMSLCNSFLEVINEGKICKIESIWSMVSSNEAQKGLQRSLDGFDKIKEKYLNGMREITKEELIEFRKKVRKDILSSYMDKIKHLEMGNQENLIRALMDGIADKLTKFEKENKSFWLKRYEEFLEREYEKFEEKSLDHESYFEFREDLQKFQEKFEKEMRGGLKRKSFFTKVSLKLWIKYLENYTRKHKKMESQKMDPSELLKLLEKKKSLETKKTDSAEDKKELAKLFELVQSQLQESRLVQDQILNQIKDQKEQKDRETMSILMPQSSNFLLESPQSKTPEPSITMDEKVMETNRFLTMALEKTEDLLKKQEAQLQKQERKLEKYREYKKFLTLAASIECYQCHANHKPLEFLPHAINCKVMQKPVESPEMTKKYEFQNTTMSFLQPNDSFSTTLNSHNHHRATIGTSSPFCHRVTSSLMPSYDPPVSYTHQIATHMKKDNHLSIDVADEREETRKAKSFYQQPEIPPYNYEEFDENSENIYSMPQPLVHGGSRKDVVYGNDNTSNRNDNYGHEYLQSKKAEDLLKQATETLSKHGEDSFSKKEESPFSKKKGKDFDLPYMRSNVGTNFWDSPLSDVMGGKKTAVFNVGEEKFKDFNLTLIPEGEMKTMNYVKKKSKDGSKGSHGGHDGEEQGVKGLVKGGQRGPGMDRRNSWNFNNLKAGELYKKDFE